MTIEATDDRMSSDRTSHEAVRVAAAPGQWIVTWLPEQRLSRDQAMTAMVLAEASLTIPGLAPEKTRTWPHVENWAAELGMTGPEAIGRIKAAHS
jgi:hypothetical protein